MLKILNNYENKEVINDYLNIIGEAYKKNGGKIEFVDSVKKIKKNELVLVPVFTDVIRLLLSGNRNIIYWVQGLDAEESYIRNNKKIRYYIINLLVKVCLEKSLFIFFVSNEMKKFYEKKYNIIINNYYIMPCFNEKIHLELFDYKGKYSNGVFAYVGSLAKWQCFEKTIYMYKKIEENFKNTKLLILTFDKETAKKIIDKYDIKNYTIDCVEKKEVSSRLKEAAYGFVIREDIPINNVSTPTKISSYMSAGLIPIFSNVIKDFDLYSKKLNYVCSIDNNNYLSKVEELLNKEVVIKDIKEEYNQVFSTYYSREFYINDIKENVFLLLKSRGDIND